MSYAQRHSDDIQKLNILIVEDDTKTLQQLTEKLACDTNLVVDTATTVQASMKKVGNREYDVILLDLGLPDATGIDVIKAVQGQKTQILVLSAMRDEASVVAAIAAGAGGYIVKDAHSEDVLSAVYDICKGIAPLSPSIARFILRQFRQQVEESSRLHSKVDKPSDLASSDFGLTAREGEVLKEITRGASYKQIAHRLKISEATVQTHIKKIYRKLGVSNRSEAAFRFTSTMD